MAQTQAVFLERPAVGMPVSFVMDGRQMTSSPVTDVTEDPNNPNWFVVRTSSGNLYTGLFQPNYQPTITGTPYMQQTHVADAPGHAGGSAVESSADERVWAMLCHLSTYFTGFLGPLIILLVKGKESALVDNQAKEALNFTITMLIYYLLSAALVLVAIGFILLPVLAIFDLIITIVAAVRAYSGEYYRYPINIRFIPSKFPNA